MNTRTLETVGLGALVCAWMIWGSAQLGNLLVDVDYGPAMASVEDDAGGTATAVEEDLPDLAVLLAAADPGAGEKVYGKCKACHTIEEGGANKVGPNLYNVVGAQKAFHEGFSYSGALVEVGGTWTYENLNAFLESPKGYAPGTKMSFAGLRKPEDRADVIAYLRENTANPPPLPEPLAEEAATEEAIPAEVDESADAASGIETEATSDDTPTSATEEPAGTTAPTDN